MIKMHPGVFGISFDLSVHNETSGNIMNKINNIREILHLNFIMLKH